MSSVVPSTSPVPKRGRGRPRGSRNRHPAGVTPTPALQPVTLRVPEAARYVGVSTSLMKRWVSEGKVRSVAIGRIRLVHTASLNELVGS